MESIRQQLKDSWFNLKSMNFREYIIQGLNLAMIVFSALMIWRGLMVFTGSDSPVVVVLSGSMEPAYQRGDILFLWLGDESDPIRMGEVCVFKLKGRDIPIVHRVLEVHNRDDGRQELLTKGDNNAVDDRALYNRGQMWLTRENIVGRARGFLPYVGMVTIMLNDYPYMKYVLIAVMGLLVLTTKE